MLYWSVGGRTSASRYIQRVTLDGATGDDVEQFVDVTDNNVTTSSAAVTVQDIVIDVKTRRYCTVTVTL